MKHKNQRKFILMLVIISCKKLNFLKKFLNKVYLKYNTFNL